MDLSQLRRRLRGLAHSSLLAALQEQLQGVPVAALAADNTGRYVAANDKASELTGYSRAELLGMNVMDLTPAMRHVRADELWSRFIQAGRQSGQYQLQRKSGRPVDVEYTAYASIAPGVHLSLITPLEE